MSELPTLTGLRAAPEWQEADGDTRLTYFDAWADAQRERAGAEGLTGAALSEVETYLENQRGFIETENELSRRPGFFGSLGRAATRGSLNTVADIETARASGAVSEAATLREEKESREAPLLETLKQDPVYQRGVRESQLAMARALVEGQSGEGDPEATQRALSALDMEIANLAASPVSRAPESVAALEGLRSLDSEFDTRIAELDTRALRSADSAIVNRNAATAEELGSSEAMERFNAEETSATDALGLLATNPALWFEIGAESAPSIAAPVLAGAVGTMASGGNPVVGGGAAAGAGFGVEVAASFSQFLAEEAGLEQFETGEQLLGALRNDGAVARAKARAVKRGIPIAAVDAVTLGLGNALTKIGAKASANVTAKTALGTAAKQAAIRGGTLAAGGVADAAGGAAGELAAQAASGQEIDMKAAIAEAVGQIATGVSMQGTEAVRGAVGAVENAAANAALGDSLTIPDYDGVSEFEETPQTFTTAPVDTTPGVREISREEDEEADGEVISTTADAPIEEDFEVVREPEDLETVLREIEAGEVDPDPVIAETDTTLLNESIGAVESSRDIAEEDTESLIEDDDDWVPFPDPDPTVDFPASEPELNPFSSDNAVSSRERLTGFQESQLDALLAADEAGRREFLESNRVPDSVLETFLEESDSDAIIGEIETRAREAESAEYIGAYEQNTVTLDEAIYQIGGLLTPRVASGKGETLVGEFSQTQKEGRRVIGRFRNDGKDLDTATTLLREMGFPFDTPNDLKEALDENDRGNVVRNNPGLISGEESPNVFSPGEPNERGPRIPREAIERRRFLEERTGFLRNELAGEEGVSGEQVSRMRAVGGSESVAPQRRGDFEAAEQLARVFGRRVVVVEDLPANGLVNRKDNENIYLNADSSRPGFTVTAHELVHQLSQSEPDLYAELNAEVDADLDAWIAEQRPALSSKSIATQKEELLADYLAEMAESPSFWSRLADRNPGVFARLYAFISDFFAKIHRYGVVAAIDVSSYLKDAVRAREAMERALVQWSSRERLRALGINHLEQGSPDTDADGDNRYSDPVEFQPRAIKDAQQVYGELTGRQDEIQGLKERQETVKSRVFDGDQPVTAERTAQAYALLDEARNGTLDVAAMTGLDAANQDLKNELFRYAKALSVSGDPALLKAIEVYGNDFFGREITVAARVLNSAGAEVSSFQNFLQIKEDEKNKAVDDIRPGEHEGRGKFSEFIEELEKRVGQEKLENLTAEDIAAIVAAIEGGDGSTTKPRKRRKVKTQREIRKGLLSEENSHYADEITDLVDSLFESDNVFADLRNASPVDKKAALDVIVTNQLSTGRRTREQFAKSLEALGLSQEKGLQVFDKIAEAREAEGKDATTKRKKRRERTAAELLAAEADAEATRVDRLNERVRKLSERITSGAKPDQRRPDPIRKLVNAQLGGEPLGREQFLSALKRVGVRGKEAVSLFEALESERAKRAEIAQLKKEAAAEESRTLEHKQAERIISALAESQSDTQNNAPRKSKRNRVRELYRSLLDFGPVMSRARFVQDLGAMSVPANASGMLYDLAMRERRNRIEVTKNRSAGTAISAQRSVPFLVRELLANPVLTMVGPNERKTIATKLFMESGGLSRTDASAAARAFDAAFVKRLQEARIELANRWVKNRNPAMKFDAPMKRGAKAAPTLSERIRRAIRSGAMDPRLRLSEELARENGWSDFTVEEVQELSRLDQLLDGENLTPFEETRYKERMFRISRKSEASARMKDALASWYLANIFSGVKTHLLAFSSLSRITGRISVIDPIAAAIGSATGNADLRMGAWLDAVSTVIDNIEMAFRSSYLTLTTGEMRGQVEKESILGIDHLRSLHDQAVKAIQNPNTSPARKAAAVGKLVIAFSRWNFRAMSAADSGIQSVMREYDKVFRSSSRAMAAGMTVSQIRALRNEVFRMTPVFESEGRDKGFEGNDLAIYVHDRTTMAIYAALEGKGVDLTRVSEEAQFEASMATGVKQIEGGYLGGLAEKLNEWANESGIAGRAVVPVVRTPCNIFHDSAWLSLWGFKRILKTAIRTKGFKEWENSEYPISLGSPRQIILRSVEASLGTALQGLLFALVAMNDDEEKEDKFFRVNLGGPSLGSEVEWRAWREAERRPYTIQIRFPGQKGWWTQGFRQGGLEPLNFAATMVGAWDQRKYSRFAGSTEAEWQAYSMTVMQELMGESLFFLRGLSRGPGTGSQTLGREAGFRASGLVPFSGLLKTANRFSEFKEDGDNFGTAFAMQMPVVPLVAGRERINALGDPLGGAIQNMTFDPQSRVGLPFGFVPDLSGPDAELYELMYLKDHFPSKATRKSLGDVTMETYDEFVKRRGSEIKKVMKSQYRELLTMSKEDFKDRLSDIQREATDKVKKAMGL